MGEPLHNRISCVMYMIKLHHVVDDKLHARSVDHTQPLPNNHLELSLVDNVSRDGGLGSAYGASNVPREILTYKSDDINGRLKAYGLVTVRETNSKTRCSRIFPSSCKRIAPLVLDMRVLDEDDQEVELRDLDVLNDEDVIHG